MEYTVYLNDAATGEVITDRDALHSKFVVKAPDTYHLDVEVPEYSISALELHPSGISNFPNGQFRIYPDSGELKIAVKHEPKKYKLQLSLSYSERMGKNTLPYKDFILSDGQSGTISVTPEGMIRFVGTQITHRWSLRYMGHNADCYEVSVPKDTITLDQTVFEATVNKLKRTPNEVKMLNDSRSRQSLFMAIRFVVLILSIVAFLASSIYLLVSNQ